MKKELLNPVIVIFGVNEVKSQERKLISMHKLLIPSRDLYSIIFYSLDPIVQSSFCMIKECADLPGKLSTVLANLFYFIYFFVVAS